MKSSLIIALIIFSYAAKAAPISSEEKIKRIVYLANPFCKFKTVGSNVVISLCALDRYPETDTTYYVDWTKNLAATIHCYLGDSSIDNLHFWIFPRNSQDPAKALFIPYILKGVQKPKPTTSKERMQALLSILPLQNYSIADHDKVTIDLFGESVRYMPTLNHYFANDNWFLKYRITLAAVTVDFVLDKMNNPYRLVQVRERSGGEIMASESYDIRSGLMEYALTNLL